VIAFYGILRAGGVVVAINPFYKEDEFTFMLKNAGIEIIIGQDENLGLIERIAPETNLRVVIISNIHKDNESLTANREGRYPGIENMFAIQNDSMITLPFLNLVKGDTTGQDLPVIDPENDAAVFQYSGGTTGTPKAAIGLHRNLAANTIQFRAWLWSLKDGQETVLAVIPLYHVYGMVIVLSMGVMLGATLLLEADPRDIDRLLEDAERYRPGLFPCVPSLYSGILHRLRSSPRKYDLSSLGICISGSAPLHQALKEQFEELTGGKVLEGYGLSEAPTATHCNPLGGRNKTGSIGLPLPDVTCKLTPYSDEDFSPGVQNIGELLIRGPQVMAGYHNTKDADHDILAGGWLHTGDIASMDEDGYFYILGRKKELIKIGGLQVWPTEIEEVISKHPAVREVCAAGVPGSEKSEIVKAWVVLKEKGEATEEDIRAWVRERLAAYKVPGLVDFRENLPRTPVGKPLRRELVREYIESKHSPHNPIGK
jgi:long-chain acyl-CoA synthetase